MGCISYLSEHVVSRLQSDAVLADISRIVEELVCNSIDASASQIRIHLEIGDSYLKVEDNGSGISREDLSLVGQRHATSKLQHLSELEAGVRTLGFRGEALSSLSNVALVEITSRVQGSPNTYKKIIKNCKTVSIGLAGQQQGTGTTVVARDIFYTLPVRRKLLFCKSSKVLQSVKDHIVRLALIHPNIAFTIYDIERQEELLHTRKAQSTLDTITDVFGKDSVGGLQQIDFAKGKFRLSGYISTCPYNVPTQALQYFYINRRFVHKTRFNRLLKSFDSSHMGGTHTVNHENQQWNLTTRRPSPAYVLNLSCPFSEYDITFESSKAYVEFKDWSTVLSFVEEVIFTIWGAQVTVSEKGNEIQKDSHLYPSISSKALPRKRKCWQHIDPTFHLSRKCLLKKDEDVRDTIHKKCNKQNVKQGTAEEKLACQRKSSSHHMSEVGSPIHSHEIQLYQHEEPSHCGITRKFSWNDENKASVESYTLVDEGIVVYPFHEGSGPYSCAILPDSLSREDLLHARFLGQVDKKFIAVCSRDIIILIDQHAADERIRLEELRKDVLCSGKKQTVSLLDHTKEIVIAFGEEHLLESYQQEIEDWGWRYKIIHDKGAHLQERQSLKSLASYKILLSAVPCIQGVDLTTSDLSEYLHQLAETHGSSSPPPAVLRVLNFKACRSAIMFGDILLPGECRQLVEALKKTSLCFQCAHGRPTMVPVMDMSALKVHRSVSFVDADSNAHAQFKSLRLDSSKPKEKWHGLQWHFPTLERCIARLKSAKAM